MPTAPALLTAATDLRTDTTAQSLEGDAYGVGVSIILNHTRPGGGPSLHRHPYGELFVVHDGEVSFTVDGATIEARGGQVVVVPPGAVHGFRNSGQRPLEMTSIHAAGTMRTEWQDAS